MVNDPAADSGTVVVVEEWEPASKAVPVPTTTSDKTPYTTRGQLTGWSFRETTGSATATVELYDGSSTGDILLASIALASAGTAQQGPGSSGVRIRNGVYLHVVSGSVKGTLYIRPARD